MSASRHAFRVRRARSALPPRSATPVAMPMGSSGKGAEAAVLGANQFPRKGLDSSTPGLRGVAILGCTRPRIRAR